MDREEVLRIADRALGGQGPDELEVDSEPPDNIPPVGELDERPAHGGDLGDTVSSLRSLKTGSAIDDVERALRAMVASLNGADVLRQRSVRTEAIRTLDGIDIRGSAGLVDAAFATVEHTNDRQGTELTLDDPEPWPEPVAGAELLEDLAALYRRYLVIPDGAEEVLALWTAHTYAIDAWEHTGYLAFVSATHRCGKSTALRIIDAVAARTISADNVSAAALYRTIEAWSPTLLVDELDRVHRESDIWGVINSGHSRGGYVLRVEGDEHEPRQFATYSAKVLCYIRGSRCPVPDTVEDRSIIIQMSRRKSSERRERLRSRTLASETAPLRRRLTRWANDYREKLEVAPELPDELDDRAADSWEPLLAVADLVGGSWPARARELAIRYSATRRDDEREAPSVMVLADLAELLDKQRLVPDDDHLAADDMCRALREIGERPWATWGRDSQGLGPPSLSRLLRPHDIRTSMIGPRGRRVRRYSATEIIEAAQRYEDDGHTPRERVGSTRTPAHTGSEPDLTDRQDRGERVCGLDVHTGGGSESEDVSNPHTHDEDEPKVRPGELF